MNSTMENPYVGTRTFSEEEAHLFFGREREARDLLALVVLERVVLFYAQSGTGKSSILNTRLIPGLEHGKGFEVLPMGRVTSDLPDDIDIDNVYVYSLMRNLVRDADSRVLAKLQLRDFLASLVRDKKSDKRIYHFDPRLSSKASGETTRRKRRVLIIDQFEELFNTHPEEWESRGDFFAQLAQALQEDPYLWVVLTMREDYVAYLDPYAHLVPEGLRVRYYMQRMEYDDALKAVKLPVKDIRPYAENVAEKLVEDLCGKQTRTRGGKTEIVRGQYVEPIVLQAVCRRLWEKLQSTEGSQITDEDVDKYIRGVDQALGEYYAERVKVVAEGETAQKRGVKERDIREWFERELITADGTRDKVVQEIGRKSGGLDDAIVQEFAKRGDLVRAERSGGTTFYELTHDRLVAPVIENNREWDIINSSYFRPQANSWEEGGRKEIDLLGGEALEIAEQWAIENPDKMTSLEMEFLQAGRIYQERKEREEKRQREIQQRDLLAAQKLADEQARSAKMARRLTTIAFSFLALALMGFIYAVQQTKEANDNADIAEIAVTTAQAASTAAIEQQATAVSLANDSLASDLARKSEDTPDLTHSILLSIQAYNTDPDNQQAQIALFKNYQKIQQRLEKKIALSGSPATDLALSPDGQVIAVWGDAGITIQNREKGEPKTFNVTGPEVKLYFNEDSKILAAVNQAGIYRWSLDDEIKQLSDDAINFHSGEITEIYTDRDGEFFISVGEDGSVLQWDLGKDENDSIPVKGEPTFSPSGKSLMTVDREDNITITTLLDADAENGLDSFQGKSPTFSPDGTLIASVNADQSVTVREIGTGETPFNIVPDLKATVHSLQFDHDGNYLAVTDGQQTQVWDIVKKIPLDTPTSGTIPNFSPDGKLLIGENSGVTSYYCLPEKRQGDTKLNGGYVSFSPEGTTLALKDQGNNFFLWSVSENCELTWDEDSTFEAKFILFNPAGEMLASLELDGTILLRDASSGMPLDGDTPLYQPEESETNGRMYFNPAGTRLAFLNDNNDLFLWDLTSGWEETPTPERIVSASITDVTFAADDILIISQKEGKITKWNLDTGAIKDLESNARGKITDLRFDSNDSRKALSISQNSVFLLDLIEGEGISKEMDGQFLDVNWERELLATLVEDKIVVWDLETGNLKDDSIAGMIAHFIPDAEQLLVGDGERIALYDLETFDLIGEPVENSLTDYKIKFSPNGKIFAAASMYNFINLYRIETDSLEFLGKSRFWYGGLMEFSSDSNSFYFNETGSYIDVLGLGTKAISSLDVSVFGNTPIYLDEKTFVYGSSAKESIGIVYLYDIENFGPTKYPKLLETIRVDSDGSVNNLDFDISKDGKILATLREDGIYIWNTDRSFKPAIIGRVHDDTENPVPVAAISPNSEKQAIFINGGIVIAEISDPSNASNLVNEHVLKITDVIFNPEGRILAVSGDGNKTVFYDVDSYEIVGEVVDGTFDKDTPWTTIRVDQDGDILDRTIWDPHAGTKIKDISREEEFKGRSPDNKYIAVHQDAQNIVTLSHVDEKLDEKIENPTIEGNFGKFSRYGDAIYFTVLSGGKTALYMIEESSNVIKFQKEDVSGTFHDFSPDGRYMALSDSEGNILIWDIAESRESARLKGKFQEFSPNSNLMAYTSPIATGTQIFLWNIATGQRLLGQQINSDPESSSFTFTPDSRILVASFDDRSTGQRKSVLLDIQTGRRIGDAFDGNLIIKAVARGILPYVFYSRADEGFVLIDPARGRLNDNRIPGDENSLIISPDGRILATKTHEGRLWDVSTGEPLYSEINFSLLEGFSPDGKVLISRDPDENTILRDAANPRTILGVIKAKEVFFSADHRYALSIDRDKDNISLWDLDENPAASRDDDFSPIKADLFYSAVFSPNGRMLALFGSGGVHLWDIDEEKLLGDSPLKEETGIPTKLIFSPTNKYLASLGSDGMIVWDIKTKKSTTVIEEQILDMAFDDEKSMTYLSTDYRIFEVDIDSGKTGEIESPMINSRWICRYALSPNGKKLAYQLNNNNIFLWDKETGNAEQIDRKIKSACSGGMAFSPDGNILAIGDGDQIHLWDSGKQSVTSMNGKGAISTAKRIVLIDKFLVVEGDSEITLWGLETGLKLDFSFTGDMEGLVSNKSKLLFRDENGLVILQDLSPGNLDRFEKIKDILCTQAGRNFFRTEWSQFIPSKEYDATCPQWPLDQEVTTVP